jgi:hypothetical protein
MKPHTPQSEPMCGFVGGENRLNRPGQFRANRKPQTPLLYSGVVCGLVLRFRSCPENPDPRQHFAEPHTPQKFPHVQLRRTSMKVYRGIPKTHNYLKKLLRLQAQGGLPVGVGLHQLDIYHDDWCHIYKGKRCNCDPDLRLKTVWTPQPQG